MNERTITEKVLAETRKLRMDGGVVITKYADRFTRDIPDMSVTVQGTTGWAELKHRPWGKTLEQVVDRPAQILFCHHLWAASGERCWVIIFEEAKWVTVWTPRALFAHLWPNVAGPSPEGWRTLGGEPAEIENIDDANLTRALRTFGAFRTTWRYDIVTRLVVDHL